MTFTGQQSGTRTIFLKLLDIRFLTCKGVMGIIPISTRREVEVDK